MSGSRLELSLNLPKIVPKILLSDFCLQLVQLPIACHSPWRLSLYHKLTFTIFLQNVVYICLIRFFARRYQVFSQTEQLYHQRQHGPWMHVRLLLKTRVLFGKRTTILYKNQIKWHAKKNFHLHFQTNSLQFAKTLFRLWLLSPLWFIVMCIMSISTQKIFIAKILIAPAKNLLILDKVRIDIWLNFLGRNKIYYLIYWRREIS